MIKILSNEIFDEEIKEGLVLVDFYADWCGPCKMMHPVLEAIDKEKENIKIIKINVDNQEELARRFTVMSIPTLMLFKDGELVVKNIGFTPKDIINGWLNEK